MLTTKFGLFCEFKKPAIVAILGLFPNSTVLLGCILAIIDFDILCALSVNVQLTKNPAGSFARTKCMKNSVGRVTF